MNHMDYVNSFIWADGKTKILCVSCNLEKTIKRQTLLKISREHCYKHKVMDNYQYRCKNCKPAGSGCGKWKGGRVLRHGYIGIHRENVPKEYRSMCSNGGCYVMEHRLVVAMREGRCLLPTEHVHHIDFNTKNNSPDNLLLIDSASHAVITQLSKIVNDQKLKIEQLENRTVVLEKINLELIKDNKNETLTGVIMENFNFEPKKRLRDIIKNNTERWNARYLMTHGLIEHDKSSFTNEQAVILREKLDQYKDLDIIPSDLVDMEFKKYRELGFPYYKFTQDHIIKMIGSIGNYNPVLKDGMYQWDGYGTGIANYFHPHIFECRKRGKLSPLEFYNSDVDFRRGIWKLLALYTKIKESNIREICHNESASSRINNFPPRAAISILKHLYTGQRIIVLDPCAGFSGRLIGSFCSGVVDKYIGIDLSEKISTGLLKTKEVLRTINDNFKIDIIQDDCLNAMNNFEGNIDCVFTSPPFLDEEEYVGVQIEKDYEKWKQNFVKPFILDAYRVLKNEGRLVVYIESIRKHNFPMDFCDIADDIGFKKEKNILFRVAYGENLRDKSISRSVKIIVFQKG